jgi:hypothetical protein
MRERTAFLAAPNGLHDSSGSRVQAILVWLPHSCDNRVNAPQANPRFVAPVASALSQWCDSQRQTPSDGADGVQKSFKILLLEASGLLIAEPAIDRAAMDAENDRRPGNGAARLRQDTAKFIEFQSVDGDA